MTRSLTRSGFYPRAPAVPAPQTLGDTGRVRLPVAVVFVAIVVLAGVRRIELEPSGALSKGELRWVRDAARAGRTRSTERLFAELGQAPERSADRSRCTAAGGAPSALRALERCPGVLAAALGDPRPSEPLRPGAAALRTACRQIARVSRRRTPRSLRTLEPDDFRRLAGRDRGRAERAARGPASDRDAAPRRAAAPAGRSVSRA